MTLRHNEVRDFTGKLLNEVCKDVRKEPSLLALNGEQMNHRRANKNDEARLDISATGFWTPGQRVFLDVRVSLTLTLKDTGVYNSVNAL